MALVMPGEACPSPKWVDEMSNGRLRVLINDHMVADGRLSCPICGSGLRGLEKIAAKLVDDYKDTRLYDLLLYRERRLPILAEPVHCENCGRYADSLLIYVPELTMVVVP